VSGRVEYLYNDVLHDNRSYTGVGKGQYPDYWDPIVDRVVTAYNQANGFEPGDANYLDANLVKAMIRVESGLNLRAYNIDPMQVNVPGDWVPRKLDFGLTKGVAPEPELGIAAGVGWLDYKAYVYNVSGEPVSFRGWDATVTRYNGGGDPNYLSKVQTQYNTLTCGKPSC
jgi:hypothetical protein